MKLRTDVFELTGLSDVKDRHVSYGSKNIVGILLSRMKHHVYDCPKCICFSAHFHATMTAWVPQALSCPLMVMVRSSISRAQAA